MKTALTLVSVSTLLVVLAIALSPPAVSQDGPAQPSDKPSPGVKLTDEEVNVWMKQKSVLSEKVMDGLTRGDFEKIRRGAVTMNVLSYFEGRAHSSDPDYKRQLVQFDFANRELIRMARDRNLEGATLAYNQLTVSCVYCHKTLRDAAAK
jgi:hypothetical protein